MWTTITQYYITPGRKGSLYTLRRAWTSHCPVIQRSDSGDEYQCSLYTADVEAALERAAGHVAPGTHIEVRGSASGTREDLSRNIEFGKYSGSPLLDITAEYLAWAVVNCAKNFTKAQHEFILDNRTDVVVLLNKAEDDRIAREKKQAEYQAKREQWEQEREQARAKSKYVACIKDRLEFTVKVIHTSTFSTEFGETCFILMKDDEGNTLKSMGTAAALWTMNKGESYQIVGTVSSHDEYKGEKGTKLSRIKIVDKIHA